MDIQEDQNAVFVCEISVEDLQGEWYKNGERIQPTSTIKLRQEGQRKNHKHVMLINTINKINNTLKRYNLKTFVDP